MTLTKIAAGHYRSPKGDARRIDSNQSPRAKWLVTLTSGRTVLVATLRHARDFL